MASRARMATMHQLSWPLLSLRLGSIRPLGPEGLASAIDKQPAPGPVWVGESGIEGDQQADRVHHGGPDKALHHYPAEHYAAWREELPDPAGWVIGGFGENLATEGLTEATACLGDVYQLGAARLQISQGRSPCRKLNLRFARPDMLERVLASGRTGWYYRVLAPGRVQPDDRLVLIERRHPDWTVARLYRSLFGPEADRVRWAALANHPALSASWRQRAKARLG